MSDEKVPRTLAICKRFQVESERALSELNLFRTQIHLWVLVHMRRISRSSFQFEKRDLSRFNDVLWISRLKKHPCVDYSVPLHQSQSRIHAEIWEVLLESFEYFRVVSIDLNRTQMDALNDSDQHNLYKKIIRFLKSKEQCISKHDFKECFKMFFKLTKQEKQFIKSILNWWLCLKSI